MACFTVLTLVVTATTIVFVTASHHGHGHSHHDYYAEPKYHFKYGVDDPKHGDHHSQWEERHGDKVKGGYSLKEADGTWRHVTYTSDKENGFNAVVERHGKAAHPYGHHHSPLKSAEYKMSERPVAASRLESTHESFENYPDGAYGYIG